MKFSPYLFLLLFPFVAFGHATPVSYTPEASTIVATSSSGEVRIRFSEPVSTSSSEIIVFTPVGRESTERARVSLDDAKELRVPFFEKTEGVYTVSWQVVSALDGHYTRGAFSFFVGATSSAPELYGGPTQNRLVTKRSFREILSPFFQQRPSLWSALRTDASRTITVSDLGANSDAFRIYATDVLGKRVVDSAPIVVLHNTKEGIGPLVVPAKSRGGGVYDVPWALLVPHGKWQIAITWKVRGEYDINTTMSINYPREIHDARERASVSPSINMLGIFLLIGISCIPILLLWYNRYYARKRITNPPVDSPTIAPEG